MKFKMPPALIIVFSVLLLITALTWVIPNSVVTVDKSGHKQIVYNAVFDKDKNVVHDAGAQPKGLWDVVLAPINGFSNAANVIVAILLSGGILAILNHVGALDAGIGVLLKKYSGSTLIIFLMIAFSLMGTVYGAWEELPAYALIIIPLFCKAGYDVLTGISVILVGATVGNMTSIVNPFSTGAAIGAIGNKDLSLGSGMLLRIVLYVVLLAVGTIMVLNYAKKVKVNKEASLANGIDVKTLVNEDHKAMPEMNKKRLWSLIVFFVAILATIVGYMPWASIPVGDKTMYDIINAPLNALNSNFLGNLLGTHTFTPWGDWYFDEFSWVFLFATIVIAFVVNRMDQKDFVKVFVGGCADLLGVSIVLAVARGVALMMGSKTNGMSVTFVYWIQNALNGVPVWAFAIGALAIYVAIGLFLQSTSGVAGITMPILGAVAAALFATASIGEVGGQIILISAFTLGLNFTSALYPSATVMGINDLTNIPYNIYLKLMTKICTVLLAASAIVLFIAPYIGLC